MSCKDLLENSLESKSKIWQPKQDKEHEVEWE